MDHRQEPAHPFAGPGSRADAIRAVRQWSSIQAATGCSRATIAKIAKRQVKLLQDDRAHDAASAL